MLFFENDYGYGAHPKVLEYLAQTNMEPVSGYGNDKFTASAAEKIKAAADCPDAQVYFLTGGTQTNMVVIDTLLRPYEGVVASSCGHVNTHEAGAIESTGHKVLTVPHKNGKLDADDLSANMFRPFTRTQAMTIWYFPAWCTSPIRLNTARFTRETSWSAFLPFARSLPCRCFWMAHASATASRRIPM